MDVTTLTYGNIISILWLVWLIYWMVSALVVKNTQQRESSSSRIAHWLPVLVGAWLLAAPLVPFGFLSSPRLPYLPLRFQIAVLLVATGLAFSCWARIHIGRNWSGSVTIKEGHELIRTGPYAYVRHPIYTGLLVAMAGSALAVGEPRAVLGWVLVLYAFVRKLRIEEGFMRQQFGERYEAYCAEVPMLAPFTAARRSGPR